jgi:hypothetical protein
MRVFDANGNEVKPSVVEINTTGRFESWQLPQGKAIIATIDPFHYEDEYDTIDSYRVKLYCLNGTMKLVGVVFVNNPLDDIANYVRDALARCQ